MIEHQTVKHRVTDKSSVSLAADTDNVVIMVQEAGAVNVSKLYIITTTGWIKIKYPEENLCNSVVQILNKIQQKCAENVVETFI